MSRPLRFVLIADTFPPLRTSGAVQLRDLSRQFIEQGHHLTVLLPSSSQREAVKIETSDGLQVVRLKAPRTKDINYVQRTLNEFLMPFVMKHRLRHSELKHERWDGVIWYAPSIFHGPLARYLKALSQCKGYLIIRDIFPEWAVDMGLMGRGLPYRFFKAVANYQYRVADIIGVQTPGNLSYFFSWEEQRGRTLEVLQNWLEPPAVQPCSLQVSQTPLAGRKILVYAGNMGVAQGMDIMLGLVERLVHRPDLGFLFVGRGSEAGRLRHESQAKGLTNVVFHDEIDPDEIPGLYAQCHIGLVSLDARHRSHNIPGKFLTYMQCGLPVLASVNKGNDLAFLVREHQVGKVCEDHTVDKLQYLADELLDQLETDEKLPERCRALFAKNFSAEQAVRQIVTALTTQDPA